MSSTSMLEQAIVDAEALKDAALKNAETIILEKYSDEIKKAVNVLLEQDEDIATEELSEEAEEKFMDNIPEAHINEDEDAEIDIDLTKLAEELGTEESEEDSSEALEEDEEIETPITSEEPEVPQIEPEAVALEEDDKEELDEDEELIANILEKLNVDVKNVPTGQAGGASNETLEKEIEEIELAQEDVDELEEDEEKKELEESVNKLKKNNDDLLEQNQKYKDVVLQLKETLEQVNLSNARLLYTNRVLESASLNERQKNKIVEALSNAGSVEEAKVIYDTLQSAVGTSRKRNPKSLSEAVTRNSSATLPRRQEENKSAPFNNRWKTLAGIK